jgi:hypothetical protein
MQATVSSLVKQHCTDRGRPGTEGVVPELSVFMSYLPFQAACGAKGTLALKICGAARLM